MPSQARFTVNLPPEARRIWDMLKRGHTHTRVAMASMAVWATLERDVQDELMMLVASVSEQGRPWSDVLDWAVARRKAVSDALNDQRQQRRQAGEGEKRISASLPGPHVVAGIAQLQATQRDGKRTSTRSGRRKAR